MNEHGTEPEVLAKAKEDLRRRVESEPSAILTAAMDEFGIVMAGADLISAERRRQIDDEGYVPNHDAEHNPTAELASAAWCYLGAYLSPPIFAITPPEWPWEDRDWKPTPGDPVRLLVKAGALIAAEIDRLLGDGSR